MWETIITGAISCAIALTITFIFNLIVNAPKKHKEKHDQELADFRKENLEQFGILSRDICQLKDENRVQMEGIQAVLKNDLKVRYLKWIKLKYAPMDAKDDLERMYNVYHKLGANGVMDSLREEFLALPELPPKGGSRRKTMTDIEMEIEQEDNE